MAVLEGLFSDLVGNTERVIKESKITVIKFRSHFSKLDVQNKIQHREFLKLTLPKITDDSTFDDVWDTFCGYFNFLNYSLLEHLIKRLGDTRLVASCHEYKERLRAFRSATLVRDFAVFITELKEQSLSMKRLKKVVVVKLNKPWDSCTLEDLERSKQNMTKKFFIPTYFLSMLKAGVGSTCVTWAIPDMIAGSILHNFDRVDVINFCKAEGIISMEIDGNICNYSKMLHCQMPSAGMFTSTTVHSIQTTFQWCVL